MLTHTVYRFLGPHPLFLYSIGFTVTFHNFSTTLPWSSREEPINLHKTRSSPSIFAMSSKSSVLYLNNELRGIRDHSNEGSNLSLSSRVLEEETENFNVETPNRTIYEPNRTVYEPNRTIYETNRTIYEPNRTEYEPNRTIYEPNRTEYEINKKEYEPDTRSRGRTPSGADTKIFEEVVQSPGALRRSQTYDCDWKKSSTMPHKIKRFGILSFYFHIHSSCESTYLLVG